MVTLFNDIKELLDIVRAAGKEVMWLGAIGLQVTTKPDDSPVTNADIAAHNIIHDALKKLTPGVPLLSEEGSKESMAEALKHKTRWISDPVDGTETMVSYFNGKKDHDGFAVHLSLMEDKKPIIGIIHFPAKGEGLTYIAYGNRVEKYEGDKMTEVITEASRRLKPESKNKVAAVSYKFSGDVLTFNDISFKAKRTAASERILDVVENRSNLATFTGGAAQWDVAAAHAIANAVGLISLNMKNSKGIEFPWGEGDMGEILTIQPSITTSEKMIKRLGFDRPEERMK